MKTLQGEKLKKVSWSTIRTGDIIYISCKHGGKIWAAGPYQVIDNITRTVRRPGALSSPITVGRDNIYRLA